MEATVEPDLDAFRDEVCAFLDSALTPELRTQGAGQTGVFAPGPVGRAWHRVLFEKGWITPMWPFEFGGIGWTPLQRYVFEQECALAEAPTLSAAGLQMCGPILISGYPRSPTCSKARSCTAIHSGPNSRSARRK